MAHAPGRHNTSTARVLAHTSDASTSVARREWLARRKRFNFYDDFVPFLVAMCVRVVVQWAHRVTLAGNPSRRSLCSAVRTLCIASVFPMHHPSTHVQPHTLHPATPTICIYSRLVGRVGCEALITLSVAMNQTHQAPYTTAVHAVPATLAVKATWHTRTHARTPVYPKQPTGHSRMRGNGRTWCLPALTMALGVRVRVRVRVGVGVSTQGRGLKPTRSWSA